VRGVVVPVVRISGRRPRHRVDAFEYQNRRGWPLCHKTTRHGAEVTRTRATEDRKQWCVKRSMQSSTTRDATRARDDGWAANVEIVAVDRDTPRRRGHRAAGGGGFSRAREGAPRARGRAASASIARGVTDGGAGDESRAERRTRCYQETSGKFGRAWGCVEPGVVLGSRPISVFQEPVAPRFTPRALVDESGGSDGGRGRRRAASARKT